MTRNITLTLDEATLQEARVLAAQHGLSVSAFLRRELSPPGRGAAWVWPRQRVGAPAAGPRASRWGADPCPLQGRTPRPCQASLTRTSSSTPRTRTQAPKHEAARDLAVAAVERSTGRGQRAGAAGVPSHCDQEAAPAADRRARAFEIVREYLTWNVVDNTGDLLGPGYLAPAVRSAVVLGRPGRAGRNRSWLPTRSTRKTLNDGQRFSPGPNRESAARRPDSVRARRSRPGPVAMR